jgi:hypothetical protein
MKYFISGHLDLNEAEFEEHYVPRIDEALKDPSNTFVIGDAPGADKLAQIYLSNYGGNFELYHMFDGPRFCLNHGRIGMFGGYQTDTDRDAAMTTNSDKDILWIRPGREKSGTVENQKRRNLLTKDNS